MSYDEEDAARDAFYDRIREELTPEIIDEFTSERLTSFYNTHPDVAEKPFKALVEARALIQESHETAAFLYAVIATEVNIKSVLVYPIVNGFIHNEMIAPLITNMVLSQTRGQFDKVKEVFLNILKEAAHFDLQTYSRVGANKNLWDEITEIQKRRNRILHAAEIVTILDAEMAIAIAAEVVEVVFPRVAQNLGFHIHEGFKLCAKHDCSPEWLAMRKRLGISPGN
jgi:hypothetical protein